jgi:hypothetical protein
LRALGLASADERLEVTGNFMVPAARLRGAG